jgi:hypothetical protein
MVVHEGVLVVSKDTFDTIFDEQPGAVVYCLGAVRVGYVTQMRQPVDLSIFQCPDAVHQRVDTAVTVRQNPYSQRSSTFPVKFQVANFDSSSVSRFCKAPSEYPLKLGTGAN